MNIILLPIRFTALLCTADIVCY